MITPYLAKLGFSDKEQQIYLALAQLGVQPASVISRHTGLDRITTYKLLKKLADRGFIRIYAEHNMQHFGIDSFEVLENHLKEEDQRIHTMLEEFPTLEQMLRNLRQNEMMVPKLQLFEGETGIKNLFNDLLFEMKEEGVQQLRVLTSNTFDERLGDVPLSRFVKGFFQEVQRRNMAVEIFSASGNLLPETIREVAFAQFDPEKLPAARGTTNIFLAGHALYIACYKDTQIGLKIKQSEMSQIFHFLFDFMKAKGE